MAFGKIKHIKVPPIIDSDLISDIEWRLVDWLAGSKNINIFVTVNVGLLSPPETEAHLHIFLILSSG